MRRELSNFAVRLRNAIAGGQPAISDQEFSAFALELFALQFQANSAYNAFCRSRGLTPQNARHWTQIPAAPASAFKELEMTSLAPEQRIAVFHSSGTTGQKSSRHFHGAESLALYEASLWPWFARCVLNPRDSDWQLVILTPPPAQAPHSSLVHMFESIRQKLGASKSAFVGRIAEDGAWTLDFDAALAALNSKRGTRTPKLLFGTAFSFVHLLDFLAEKNLRIELPPGSRAMETGGYKNRSRSLPKAELHALITGRLGIASGDIVCEYGMSELSSQAYAVTGDGWRVAGTAGPSRHPPRDSRRFSFPSWARPQIISPETGREVADGETGLVRIFDLANVFSVAAIQTEDMAVRSANGFELIGRAQFSEPRGCSLQSAVA